MTTIHRLLDEAFAGIEPTPEVADLKEEIRANLTARVADLEASGTAPADAAGRAMAELGDVRALVAGLPDHEREHPFGLRVRPRPAFVMRTVLLVLIAAAAVGVLALEAFGAIGLALPWLAAAAAALTVPIGIVIADALRQETTANYPLSTGRAIGFGIGGGAVLAALGVGWLVVRGLDPLWLVGATVLAVAAIVLFAYLAATKTNRHKAWVLRHGELSASEGDRFTRDPAAAARFGIYNLVIWFVAIVAFIVLTFTVGWTWSWIALAAGFVLMLIMVARMVFPPTA